MFTPTLIRPSIFRIIRSAHWTTAATSDSVLGLERLSNRSSVVFRAQRESFRPSLLRCIWEKRSILKEAKAEYAKLRTCYGYRR
jgi:hypothetical protein